MKIYVTVESEVTGETMLLVSRSFDKCKQFVNDRIKKYNLGEKQFGKHANENGFWVYTHDWVELEQGDIADLFESNQPYRFWSWGQYMADRDYFRRWLIIKEFNI